MELTKVDLNDFLVLNSADNVEVSTKTSGNFKKGHKRATRTIEAGSPIIKFGHIIGSARQKISKGDHVHTHNVDMPSAQLLEAQHESVTSNKNISKEGLPNFFWGYQRANGDVGTRNYIVVVSSVNCSATVVKAICRHFDQKNLPEFIDGIVPVTHTQGCAQEIGGLGYQVLNRTLAGWIFHPNVVGAVVMGLGCEGTTFESIVKNKGDTLIPTEHMNIQDVGGTAQAIELGIASVKKVLSQIPKLVRTKASVSHIKVALNCGGSDGFSAITANPVLGGMSDILTSLGGTAALAEIPECHGCEDLLYKRSVSDDVRNHLKETFGWWEKYTARHNVQLNDNLAPGNIEGGITTIIEKSLGAVAKGGTSRLTQVVDYAEKITAPGFVLMNTPGFDPVSVTGLVSGGCNIVAFTTGRGSVYGCGIAPTIKVTTTTELFDRMKGDMDFDAGKVLREGTTEPTSRDFYKFLVSVASGEVKTCSEKLGLGWEEFVPWAIGETL